MGKIASRAIEPPREVAGVDCSEKAGDGRMVSIRASRMQARTILQAHPRAPTSPVPRTLPHRSLGVRRPTATQTTTISYLFKPKLCSAFSEGLVLVANEGREETADDPARADLRSAGPSADMTELAVRGSGLSDGSAPLPL